MPVAVACPKCQKKFSLPDNMMGKPVKCSACSTQFQTPAKPNLAVPRAKQTAAAPAAAKLNLSQKAVVKPLTPEEQIQARLKQQADELKRLGVEGPLQRPPDLFAGLPSVKGTPDPLANMVLEDPGFADGGPNGKSVRVEKSQDPLAALLENPAIEKKKKVVAVTQRKKKPWYKTVWFWILVTLLIAAIVAVLIFLVF